MVKTNATSHCSTGDGTCIPKSKTLWEVSVWGQLKPLWVEEKQYSICAAAATTKQPSPIKQNSSRVHSPLTILISLPLAKGSPQFPLPPRAAAFIFPKVVNYNSRAKSTISFFSYVNNLIPWTLLFLLSSSPRHTAFIFLPYLAFTFLPSFSANTYPLHIR